jgi:hydrogenase/urease accessory protein HupE
MGAITLTRRARCATAVLALALGHSVRVFAHDPGLSALDVRVDRQKIVAVLSLAAADAMLVGGRDGAARLALESIELRCDGGSLSGTLDGIWSDESNGVHARIVYQRQAAATLILRSDVPARLLRGHRELVSIKSQDGTLLAERMLDAGSNEVSASVSRRVTTWQATATRFIALGIEHILTGYDHLLFLAGVLVVIRRWRDVIQTITAFTVAHSITLALATLGLVTVPARIVEPLIAASIVYVGVENLVRHPDASRWKLTFAFGLIHGLGFATALGELGIGGRGIAVALPLASFNAGVEIGQVAVALPLVPLFTRMSATPASRLRFASAGSLIVVLAGSYWLLERLGS